MGFKEKLTLAKEDKKKMIWLFSAAMVVIVLLLFLEGGEKETPKENTVTVEETANDYDQGKSLEQILGRIEGVGSVSVTIEYDGTSYKEYAYNEEVSERVTNGDAGSSETTTSKEIVLLNGDATPVVIEEHFPDVKGVVIVAVGADDAKVRQALLKTATTYLDIGANRVEICTGEVIP